jgi:hypothetical protein
MASKDEIRKHRDRAIAGRLGIAADDKIVEMIPRQDGLYMVSLEKIIRINLPDEIDPDMDHENAPITQTAIAGKGSRSPIVARTILQARDFCRFLPSDEHQGRTQDIAWEVMLSLLAFDRTIEWLRNSIAAKKAEISESYKTYVSGSSPPPPPVVEGLEIEFRSAVLIANHALNAISELFPALFEMKFTRGRFDRIIAWSIEKFGRDDLLSLMLTEDHRWINLWGEVRNAFEHPSDGYYVKVNNFCLLPNRQIQLPTWQLKHPKLDVFRPQTMVETLEIYRENILGFFENLLFTLTDKAIKLPMPIGVIDREEQGRDPDCPKRYEITSFVPRKAETE